MAGNKRIGDINNNGVYISSDSNKFKQFKNGAVKSMKDEVSCANNKLTALVNPDGTITIKLSGKAMSTADTVNTSMVLRRDGDNIVVITDGK